MNRALLVACVALVALVTVAAGCGNDPRKQRGEACELNSQCDAPLVCRIGACRVECATTRDCGPGSQCVRDEMGFGACTIERESSCTMASECQRPLVCGPNRRCIRECATDRDCATAEMCTMGGCVDPATTVCVRDSECMIAGMNLVCARDARCRVECLSDRECRYGTRCDRCDGRCRDPLDFMMCDAGTDAGIRDGGGGTLDGGADMDASTPGLDAGPIDAGPFECVPPCAPGRSTAVELALGFDFSCARIMDGRVLCWGNGSIGQLGSSCAGTRSAAPRIVQGITNAIGISASSDRACAKLADGRVACWGSNSGRRSDPATMSFASLPPAIVAVPGTVTSVAVGNTSTQAIADGNTLYGWGDAINGSLGDGTIPYTAVTAPVLGGTFPGSIAVAAYRRGGCLLAGGTVTCWGENAEGQAGLGDMLVHATPTAIGGIPPIASISADANHVCAVTMTGTALCWGSNGNGACGDGTTTARLPTPTPVVGLTGLTAIEVGVFHTCALRIDGTVACWGMNTQGELGDGTTIGASHPTPQDVIALPVPASAISAGGHHTCAIVSGDVYCWGEGGAGQTGDATFVVRPIPGRVPCLP